ncbi:unnamed protein product [Pylaiella littoralis]
MGDSIEPPEEGSGLTSRNGEQQQQQRTFDLEPESCTPQMWMEDLERVGSSIIDPLHHATANGRVDIVKFMLGRGYDRDALGRQRCPPLQVAARKGLLAMVHVFLAAGADTKLRCHIGRSALDVAASRGDVNIARAIIEHGADVNAACTRGLTPLFHAAVGGQAEMVLLLCDKWGAAIDALDHQGCTPLHMAARSGHVAAARALLTAGADVTIRCRERGMSALDLAVFNGHVDIAKAVIEYGADVNAAREDGQRPLSHAVCADNEEMVSLLCLKGAAIDAFDGLGWTALQKAAVPGHVAATRALLTAGADVTVRCRQHGMSALDLAAFEGHVDIARVIIEHGADVNAAPTGGRRPLFHAACAGREEVMPLLCLKGAAINALNAGGWTALHGAVISGHVTATRALLTAGADLVVRSSEDGMSALDLAAFMGHVDIAKAVIEHGTDVNAATADGWTPLYHAVNADNEEMVSLLCLEGAAVDALDDLGWTALHWAVNLGHVAATRALLTAGADGTVRCSGSGMSALDVAVSRGPVDIAKAVIEHGMDVNTATADGRRPLYHAVIADNEEMVSLLCLEGAAVDALDDLGWTALHWAVKLGRAAAALALLTAGADGTLRCRQHGMSALDWAVSMGRVDIARVVIEHGADVNAARADGRRPLYHAVYADNKEMVSLLCLEGAAVDALDDLGWTALHWAVRQGHAAATRALFAAGADVSRRCSGSGMSALDLAARGGHVDIARVVIEHGAAVDAAGDLGLAPLHIASKSNKGGVIDLLVEAGATVGAKTKPSGDTPLHLAALMSSFEAVLVLLKHGASVSTWNNRGEAPLHAAARKAGTIGTAEVVDVLLKRGADEKLTNSNGETAGDVVGIAVEEENSSAEDVERVRRLLANAPVDRAWRRRGFLVMCRAHFPVGRVQLGQGNDHAHAGMKRRRSDVNRSRGEVDWAGVASMLMGMGADPISLMGDGANIIFETIVGFL